MVNLSPATRLASSFKLKVCQQPTRTAKQSECNRSWRPFACQEGKCNPLVEKPRLGGIGNLALPISKAASLSAVWADDGAARAGIRGGGAAADGREAVATQSSAEVSSPGFLSTIACERRSASGRRTAISRVVCSCRMQAQRRGPPDAHAGQRADHRVGAGRGVRVGIAQLQLIRTWGTWEWMRFVLDAIRLDTMRDWFDSTHSARGALLPR